MADEQPELTAEKMVAAYGYNIDLAPSVVLVIDDLRQRRWQRGIRRRGTHPFRKVDRVGEHVDMVQAIGPGAPVADITVEFLAALGVERVVLVGTAGALTPPAPSTTGGNARVVDRAFRDQAFRDDAASQTTISEPETHAADPALITALGEVFGGPLAATVTTDVPFRQTPARLHAHRRIADFIEMEAASVFAAASSLGLAAAAVLIPSDHFGADGWKPVTNPNDELRTAVTQVAHALSCR